jgi:chorismate-pyruvate lyase
MRKSGRLVLAFIALCAVASPVVAAEQAMPVWPDKFVTRVELLAIMETLNATLLAARSATFTLDKWCADHKLASDTKVRARLLRSIDKPVSDEQRQRLQITSGEPVKFRHVELACGDRILSEADNWYVPSRLTPEMNRTLETTDTPFGRAVASLKPFRQTFAVTVLWKPLADGWEHTMLPADHAGQTLTIPPHIFEHRALVYRSDFKPVSEVDEVYTRENLAFTPPG